MIEETRRRMESMMILLIIAINLVLAKKEQSDDKIVGGRIASNIPFLVSIQVNNHHLCGGSLLSLSTILTACHCVGDYKQSPKDPEIEVPVMDDPEKYHIVAGDFDLRVRSYRYQKRQVSEMYHHPACIKQQGTLQWDFGVMKVSTPFEETKFVKATKLYSLVKKSFEERISHFQGKKRTRCWVMGWGKAVLTSEGASTSRYLKAVQMRIITDEECRYYLSQQNPMYVNYSFGSRAQMCAVGFKWAESDCQGDSGGPVYCKGHVLGTVSYGFDCGRGDQPAVYTKVSEFIEWFKTFENSAEARGLATPLVPFSYFFISTFAIPVVHISRYLIYSPKTGFG